MGACVLARNALYGTFNETHFCGKASVWKAEYLAFTRRVSQNLKGGPNHESFVRVVTFSTTDVFLPRPIPETMTMKKREKNQKI